MVSVPATKHFFWRARQRWGFAPADDEVHAIVDAIRAGEALLSISGASCNKYYVCVRGIARRVTYNADLEVLVTALGGPAVPWEQMQALLDGAFV